MDLDTTLKSTPYLRGQTVRGGKKQQSVRRAQGVTRIDRRGTIYRKEESKAIVRMDLGT